MRLVDRQAECGKLDGLVEAVRAGQSRALVLSGEAGVGKSALLQYLILQAAQCRVVQTAGVESEMELAFAGLHQLCAPLLAGLEDLPERQGDALRIVLGIGSGPAPDRFLVGLATLGLLAHAAEQQPLMCVVDDQQWLDRASAQVLGFVARRLAAESVGLVFAARVPTSDVAGLSQLSVQGLGPADARALLDTEVAVPLDGWVRDQLVAETRGNPLALLEWPRALTTQQWAGGFGLPAAVRLPGGVAEGFRQRVQILPEPTRRLLLIAAADPLGDAGNKDSIANAVSQWDSEELDKTAAEAGVVYAIVRTPEEWAAHPQGKYLADKPLVEIIKIGDSDPEPFTPAARPLSGLRVLAATHVIAGNVMARTLAEHGAEVLQIAHPEEFENEGLMQDPCAGFTSSAWLDLAQPEGLRRAYELAAGADVFVENYRGRKIADLGMSPEELAARRPGIIYASGKAFSHDGPWANRSGMDMEALCVTGFTTEEGTAEQPKFPPTKVMNDYIAGYIGAAGIQAALIRRAKEGGSYHVRVNLARCAMWFMSLGTFDKDAPAPTGEQHQLLAPDTITAQTPYGELVRLAPPVQFSETKPYWRDPVLVVRGSSKPAWTTA